MRGHTTLKLFSAGGFKNFNIIHPRIIVKIDTKARPYGLKVYCDALMIHATDLISRPQTKGRIHGMNIGL